MSEVNIWDRQANETEEAFAAFWRWRDSSPRPKLIDIAASINRPYAVVMRWHRENAWDARGLAWDRRIDAVRQEAVLDTLDEMHKRHVGMARRAQRIAEKAMEDIEKRVETLTPRDMIRIADVAIKLERLSRGEVTERVEGTNYAGLSDDELKFLEQLAKRSAV